MLEMSSTKLAALSGSNPSYIPIVSFLVLVLFTYYLLWFILTCLNLHILLKVDFNERDQSLKHREGKDRID